MDRMPDDIFNDLMMDVSGKRKGPPIAASDLRGLSGPQLQVFKGGITNKPQNVPVGFLASHGMAPQKGHPAFMSLGDGSWRFGSPATTIKQASNMTSVPPSMNFLNNFNLPGQPNSMLHFKATQSSFQPSNNPSIASSLNFRKDINLPVPLSNLLHSNLTSINHASNSQSVSTSLVSKKDVLLPGQPMSLLSFNPTQTSKEATNSLLLFANAKKETSQIGGLARNKGPTSDKGKPVKGAKAEVIFDTIMKDVVGSNKVSEESLVKMTMLGVPVPDSVKTQTQKPNQAKNSISQPKSAGKDNKDNKRSRSSSRRRRSRSSSRRRRSRSSRRRRSRSSSRRQRSRSSRRSRRHSDRDRRKRRSRSDSSSSDHYRNKRHRRRSRSSTPSSSENSHSIGRHHDRSHARKESEKHDGKSEKKGLPTQKKTSGTVTLGETSTAKISAEKDGAAPKEKKKPDPEIIKMIHGLWEHSVKSWTMKDYNAEKPTCWFLFDEKSVEYRYYRFKLAAIHKMKNFTKDANVQADTYQKSEMETIQTTAVGLQTEHKESLLQVLPASVKPVEHSTPMQSPAGKVVEPKSTATETASSPSLETIVEPNHSIDKQFSEVDASTKETAENLARFLVEVGPEIDGGFDLDIVSKDPEFWFLNEQQSPAYKYYHMKLTELCHAKGISDKHLKSKNPEKAITQDTISTDQNTKPPVSKLLAADLYDSDCEIIGFIEPNVPALQGSVPHTSDSPESVPRESEPRVSKTDDSSAPGTEPPDSESQQLGLDNSALLVSCCSEEDISDTDSEETSQPNPKNELEPALSHIIGPQLNCPQNLQHALLVPSEQNPLQQNPELLLPLHQDDKPQSPEFKSSESLDLDLVTEEESQQPSEGMQFEPAGRLTAKEAEPSVSLTQSSLPQMKGTPPKGATLSPKRLHSAHEPSDEPHSPTLKSSLDHDFATEEYAQTSEDAQYEPAESSNEVEPNVPSTQSPLPQGGTLKEATKSPKGSARETVDKPHSPALKSSESLDLDLGTEESTQISEGAQCEPAESSNSDDVEPNVPSTQCPLPQGGPLKEATKSPKRLSSARETVDKPHSPALKSSESLDLDLGTEEESAQISGAQCEPAESSNSDDVEPNVPSTQCPLPQGGPLKEATKSPKRLSSARETVVPVKTESGKLSGEQPLRKKQSKQAPPATTEQSTKEACYEERDSIEAPKPSLDSREMAVKQLSNMAPSTGKGNLNVTGRKSARSVKK
ncbi:serine/arginine repetitive matrix protein 2-like isoform X2 [Ambystoma mexicanum]|uniref:serine/arginine repetitive matrix protein 2-like isoform X2 n=1 Tax=Ambystoma mexicanum TaxID=8296 RepID=UPI0037E983C5